MQLPWSRLGAAQTSFHSAPWLLQALWYFTRPVFLGGGWALSSAMELVPGTYEHFDDESGNRVGFSYTAEDNQYSVRVTIIIAAQQYSAVARRKAKAGLAQDALDDHCRDMYAGGNIGDLFLRSVATCHRRGSLKSFLLEVAYRAITSALLMDGVMRMGL